MNGFEKYDKKGRERCHAMCCFKIKNLQEVFGGKFCEKHVEQLGEIRKRLNYAKKKDNKFLEILCRQEEIEIRKFAEVGHMMFQRNLEKNYL
jgi:hypothetical protein